ncbi:MAG: NTP transferase domain-containing protein [Chthoniobacterales bacterium]|nr:NTP transferase domain-containing protein [Chthoniobacterales bacterium]
MNESSPDVTDALILMAGAGSRLGAAGGAPAKPLVRIGGRPLICYALDVFERAGVRRLHVVLGANSERLMAELEPLLPAEMSLNAIVNPDWRKQNGVSVLSAVGQVRAPFFLAMGDHLFEFSILETLLSRGDRRLVNLAIDRKVESIFDLDDAMKVQTQGDGIVAIAKDLAKYNAIDTGVFLCSEEIFIYLQRVRAQWGDCSLSDGVRLLAADEKMRAVDIGEAWWQDVDTPEMLARAEQESARFLRQGGGGLTEESVTGQS